MGRGDLTDAEWERLAPLLPADGTRGGRWNDHRTVINGVLYRIRTGVPWRDLPERYGCWVTVYKQHRRWRADGTWERLLTEMQAIADEAGRLDWDVAVDSTPLRAHRHAAGAPRQAPHPPAGQQEEAVRTKRGDPIRAGLRARLAEVVKAASA
ncbi:IS5 family transposase [Nonomuraea sp. 160415]|uniref:IS5 family transposase n=1 Tax=Nonomuraea basaltis TaxID=2495887 RepID=UPI00110C6F89|nr:IS5 family transposase [Nonomuraea basaltis]